MGACWLRETRVCYLPACQPASLSAGLRLGCLGGPGAPERMDSIGSGPDRLTLSHPMPSIPLRMYAPGREPCPYRIVDDVGGAFCMGSIGGGIWHYFKGLRNAPKGERLRGGVSSIKARAPVVGGKHACLPVFIRLAALDWIDRSGSQINNGPT